MPNCNYLYPGYWACFASTKSDLQINSESSLPKKKKPPCGTRTPSSSSPSPGPRERPLANAVPPLPPTPATGSQLIRRPRPERRPGPSSARSRTRLGFRDSPGPTPLATCRAGLPGGRRATASCCFTNLERSCAAPPPVSRLTSPPPPSFASPSPTCPLSSRDCLIRVLCVLSPSPNMAASGE